MPLKLTTDSPFYGSLEERNAVRDGFRGFRQVQSDDTVLKAGYVVCIAEAGRNPPSPHIAYADRMINDRQNPFIILAYGGSTAIKIRDLLARQYENDPRLMIMSVWIPVVGPSSEFVMVEYEPEHNPRYWVKRRVNHWAIQTAQERRDLRRTVLNTCGLSGYLPKTVAKGFGLEPDPDPEVDEPFRFINVREREHVEDPAAVEFARNIERLRWDQQAYEMFLKPKPKKAVIAKSEYHSAPLPLP